MVKQKTKNKKKFYSPAAAFISDLQLGSLDDALDVSSQVFAQQVHTQWLSGNKYMQISHVSILMGII